MLSITHSQSTDSAGVLKHRVIVGASPINSDSTDEKFVAALARETYHAHKGRAVLKHWDGDAGRETILESK